jgi:hypothetical protein
MRIGLNKIFVEGQIDKLFIDAVLKKHFNLEDETLVISVDGKDKLSDNPILSAISRKVENAKNLLIFDTDYISKGGGRAKRIEDYKAVATELGVIFDFFLLPSNDETEGEVEDLIKTCFNTDFLFFDKCWDEMINCLSKNESKKSLNVPAKEGFLFSKIDLFKNFREDDNWNYAKLTKYNYADKGIWNLEVKDNPILEKLVNFIKDHLFDE